MNKKETWRSMPILVLVLIGGIAVGMVTATPFWQWVHKWWRWQAGCDALSHSHAMLMALRRGDSDLAIKMIDLQQQDALVELELLTEIFYDDSPPDYFVRKVKDVKQYRESFPFPAIHPVVNEFLDQISSKEVSEKVKDMKQYGESFPFPAIHPVVNESSDQISTNEMSEQGAAADSLRDPAEP